MNVWPTMASQKVWSLTFQQECMKEMSLQQGTSQPGKELVISHHLLEQP